MDEESQEQEYFTNNGETSKGALAKKTRSDSGRSPTDSESNDINEDNAKKKNNTNTSDSTDSINVDSIKDAVNPLKKKKNKDSPMEKLASFARKAQTVNTGMQAGMMFLLMQKAFMAAFKMLQVFSKLYAMVMKFITGIAHAITGFLQGLLGLSMKVATIAAYTILLSSFAGVIGLGIAVVQSQRLYDHVKTSSDLVCGFDDKSDEQVNFNVAPVGEAALLQREYANKAYSVMSELGYAKEFTAAMLGNWQVESGIDPTSVETVYSEPHQIGPRKAHAIKVNFDVMQIDPVYGSTYPAIHKVGIGLGQWTNDRNTLLTDYAKSVHQDWFDFTTQLMFMMTKDTRAGYMQQMRNTNISVDAAVKSFLVNWEGNPGDKLAMRTAQAKYWLNEFKSMTVDKDFASSVIDKMDVDVGSINHYQALSASSKNDTCAKKLADKLEEMADGTGVFPQDVQGWAWTPDSIPDSLKKFTHDPRKYGLSYGGSKNWIEKSGQCVDFSNSYFSVLYPKQAGITYGNGKDTAYRWAERFGKKVSKIPKAGSVFSCENSYSGGAGHTGVVEHVFANGDILVIEQNTAPYSGDSAGKPNTWNWRKITKAEYTGEDRSHNTWNWVFFKPDVPSAWSTNKS